MYNKKQLLEFAAHCRRNTGFSIETLFENWAAKQLKTSENISSEKFSGPTPSKNIDVEPYCDACGAHSAGCENCMPPTMGMGI